MSDLGVVAAPKRVVVGGAADELPGGGTMGALIRNHDWAKSPLGERQLWPRSLKTAVGICVEAPQPMLVAWGDALCTLYNDGYLSLHGADGLGRPLEEHAPNDVEAFRTVLKSGGAVKQRVRALLPLRDDAGHVNGVLAMVHDHETMVGAVGHDLRNPLAAILTAAQLLERRAGDDERFCDPARRIVSSTERMAHMLEQFLEYGQLQGSGLELRPGACDVGELAREALDAVGTQRVGWKASLDFQGDLRAQLDAERVIQVIGNLAGNAARHASAGCRVRVDGSSPSVIVVAVENDGELPEGVKLFEPFSAWGPTKGVGLGLFVSRAVVEAHGGTVNAESAAGITRFTIALPRQPRPMNAR